VLLSGGGWLIFRYTQDGQGGSLWGGVVLLVLGLAVATGFLINPPNISKVITFFGRYLGTIRRNGLVWTVPLSARQTISLRIQNFNSEILKVNDANGNPIDIGAVIVWRVV
jgi:regulator of protease activity HflC (stomatin/prohibitin superfamily)